MLYQWLLKAQDSFNRHWLVLLSAPLDLTLSYCYSSLPIWYTLAMTAAAADQVYTSPWLSRAAVVMHASPTPTAGMPCKAAQQMAHLSVADEGSWGSPSAPKASPGAKSCTISSGG